MPSEGKFFSLNSIYLNPTDKCNLKCSHCWISPPHVRDVEDYLERGRTAGGDVDFTHVRRAVEEALPLGLSRVKLTGGEPFLRPDVLELMEHLCSLDLNVDVETNATLLEEECVRGLKRCGVDHVSVSLDGVRAETHDGFRGVDGAFDRAVKGLKLLLKHDILTEIIFSLHRGNVDELESAAAMAHDMGVGTFKINPVIPSGRGKLMMRNGGNIAVRELLELDRRMREDVAPKLDLNIVFSVPMAFKPMREVKESHMNECGILNILGILAGGDVSICGIGRLEPGLVMGNIGRTSIAHIWNESPVLKKLREEVPRRLEGVCARCILKNVCLGACRANAYTLRGNLTAPYWICQEAYEEGLFPAGRLWR